MRKFYPTCILFIFLFSLTSCFFSTEKEGNQLYRDEYDEYDDGYYSEDNEYSTIDNEIRNGKSIAINPISQKGIKYFEDFDSSMGMVSSRTPLPSNWKKSKQPGVLYEGPHNIRMYGTSTSSFQYTNDQQIAWAWQQQGIQNVPPMSFDQITEQFILPVAREKGVRLNKTYPLPKLARTMTIFNSLLFSSVPNQKDIKAYGLEWTDNNGISYISALIITISYAQPTTAWNFTGQYLEAPNAYFDKAKEAFLYGITNFVADPQYLQVCNKRDAQRAGVQYRAHLGRMAAINARSSSSKSVGDIYSEISDINHAGYLKRNDINSNGHSKTINMIGERTIIGNHDTGEHYNAPSGSKYYWVNNNGTAIGTNNSLYDPRIDKRINQMEWTQFYKEN